MFLKAFQERNSPCSDRIWVWSLSALPSLDSLRAFMWCRNYWGKKQFFRQGKFRWEVWVDGKKLLPKSCCVWSLYCFFCSFLSLKYRKQLSMSCLNNLSDKMQKQKHLFGIHAAPVFRHDAHEHNKVARKTPQLGKWHKPRST